MHDDSARVLKLKPTGPIVNAMLKSHAHFPFLVKATDTP